MIAKPSTVKIYLDTLEDLYKSEEYTDDMDTLENLVDTLLQIIMDDGNSILQAKMWGMLNILYD